MLALAIAGVISLLILLSRGFISHWIELTPHQEELLQPLILVGLALFSTGLLSGIADAVLISTRQFAPSYALEIAETVATTGLTWLVLLLGRGLLAVAVVTAATQCASTVLKLMRRPRGRAGTLAVAGRGTLDPGRMATAGPADGLDKPDHACRRHWL